MATDVMDKIVSLAKRRGFIYPGSEIYGGLANTYDYGPVGVELLRNIKNLWWKEFVQKRADIVGLDASIISSAAIWEASGHTAGFSDAMIDCKHCKSRYRADHIIEDYLESTGKDLSIYKIENLSSIWGLNGKEDIEKIIKDGKVEGQSPERMSDLIRNVFKIKCPKCKKVEWTEARQFNLLFPVQLGIVEGAQSLAYLRGETAQGIFINFANVADSTRVRLPFGIGQVGKSFRNEITLGNSIFRTIEFEQGEIEYFFDPEQSNWEELFEQWKKDMRSFIENGLGVKSENLRWRVHTDEERSFYSQKTEDLEYNYPFGFKELWGLAYRTNYDLKQHQEKSNKSLEILDPKTNKKILPHVIEPAVGINRLMLMVLSDAYTEEDPSTGSGRIVMKFNPKIAPYKVAVFPLLANKEELVGKAKEIYDVLREQFMTAFDDRGNIGKRYLYQDEIGTPWCVTVDFETLDDGAVTVRDRDTMTQERVKIEDLVSYLSKKLA